MKPANSTPDVEVRARWCRRNSMTRWLLAAALLPIFSFAYAGDEPYRVVIKFGSLCCGPDATAVDRVASLMKGHESETGRLLKKRWVVWGLEGDMSLCLRLED